jgi:hypothetical protein
LNCGVPFESFEPKTAAKLQEYLGHVAGRAARGLRPIIHFDTHGSEADGIQIAPSGENVSWATLVEWLRPINRETRNNLCIVSAACFSMQVYTEITIEKECPFFVMIAPERVVSFGFIADHIPKFYDEVFRSSNIVTAHRTHLKKGLTLFHCERALLMGLIKYVRRYRVGEGAQQRREQLLTQVLERGIPNTPQNRKSIRTQSKALIKPTQELIDRYVNRFLIGKPVAFTLDDVIESG